MKTPLIITQINIEHHRRAFDKLLDQKPKKSVIPKTTTTTMPFNQLSFEVDKK